MLHSSEYNPSMARGFPCFVLSLSLFFFSYSKLTFSPGYMCVLQLSKGVFCPLQRPRDVDWEQAEQKPDG